MGVLFDPNKPIPFQGTLEALGLLGQQKPPTPAGDTIPDAPQLAGDDTGIRGPGAGPTKDDTPGGKDDQRGGQTVSELGQGVVDTEEQRARDQQAAQEEDQARASEFAEGVKSDVDETTGAIDETRAGLQEDQARFQEDLEETRESVQNIPTEVTNEFNRLRDEFGDAADASFDRLDSQRSEALASVDQGRSAAMQAAVQGIQGNVNGQVASIQANSNLTQAQKTSMIAQVRLSGASSMAPAIGQTVLQFNQLSADVATKFGAITGQLESTGLQGRAQLAGLQGQAFSQAQIAVGQMTSQLLEIDASASVGFANAQSQLLATRSHATMTGNDILLRTLPEQSTPYLDLTGAATASYEISRDILLSQFEMDAQRTGMDLQIAMMRSMQGNPISNIFEGFMGGFQFGGLAGGVLGAVGGAFSNAGPTI